MKKINIFEKVLGKKRGKSREDAQKDTADELPISSFADEESPVIAAGPTGSTEGFAPQGDSSGFAQFGSSSGEYSFSSQPGEPPSVGFGDSSFTQPQYGSPSTPSYDQYSPPSAGYAPQFAQTGYQPQYSQPQYGSHAPPFNQYSAQYGQTGHQSTPGAYSYDFGSAYPYSAYGAAQPDNRSDGGTDDNAFNFSPYDFDTQHMTEAIVPADSVQTELSEPFAFLNSAFGESSDPDGLNINWNDDSIPVSRLNIKNFLSFADARFDSIFLSAYSGTRNKDKSLNITVSVLARMLSYEAFTENAAQLPVSQAIENALYVFMTKSQRAAAEESSLQMDNVKQKPSMHERRNCIQKAFEKGKREIPRYAPVFSGTTGATVVLLIVAVIIAATAFIWARPFGVSDPTLSGSDSGSSLAQVFVDPLSAINPRFLVEMGAQTLELSPGGEAYNTGAVPVSLSLEGPDVVSLSGIFVANQNGYETAVYQYDTGRYCFAAENNGNYRIEATDTAGNTAHEYVRVSGLEAPETELLPISNYYAVPHDRESVLQLFNEGSFDDGRLLYLTKSPKSGEISLSEDMLSINYIAKDGIGVDSFTLQLYDPQTAKSTELVFPLIIYNNAPTVDKALLVSDLVHTPGENGVFAGYLSASDADGDAMRFELADTENCSVLLAPNGGFICIVDEDCTEDSASFGFTVSDGLITSIVYRRVFMLANRLLGETEFEQEFVCYSGEDAWYTLELPMTDLDGDTLRWRVISPLTNGLTEKGNAVKVNVDGSAVSYKLDPAVDESYDETLLLICTDGWDSSDAISYICHVRENAPPAAGSANRADISSGETVVCRLDIVNDCVFDKLSDCIIIRIERAEGGDVLGSEGWNELMFSFTHDGKSEDCFVDAVVADRLTGKSSTVRFKLNVR